MLRTVSNTLSNYSLFRWKALILWCFVEMHRYLVSLCKRTRSDLCRKFLVESNSFLSFQTGKGYKIRSKLSYNSKNIIYLASCKRCRLQYVGSTTTDFRVRFRNHKSAMVTKKKSCEVTLHFNETSHDLIEFSFQCIDQVLI